MNIKPRHPIRIARASIYKLLLEILVIGSAYFTYMVVRRFLISDIEGIAFDNARRLISFEMATGIFTEQKWQGWALENARDLVLFFNWAYIVTFAPILIIAGVAVYIADRARYRYYRNVIFVSFGFALLLFALLPLAPPRFMPEYGFIDTIQEVGGVTSWYGGREFSKAISYNVFAAMPSLQFGWTLMYGIMLYKTGFRVLKVFGVLYPSVTFFAITLTGNHYIMDAVGGGAVALASFLFYEILLRAKSRYPEALSATKSSAVQVLARAQSGFVQSKNRAEVSVSVIRYRYRLWRHTARNRRKGFPFRPSM